MLKCLTLFVGLISGFVWSDFAWSDNALPQAQSQTKTEMQKQEMLTQFDNQYSARLYGFRIDVTSRFTRNTKGFYEYYFAADSLVGDVVETSEMLWDEKNLILVPQVYSYKRTGMGKNRDDALLFDWKNLDVVNLKTQTRLAISPEQHVQDNLSYQVQLRLDLMRGKNDFVYPITNGKKTRDYKFDIVGEENLETPLGTVRTVKVKRSQTNDKRETYAWFAKDFQYLLVCLQQEENGSAYTIYISKANINGKAIEHF